MWRARPRSTTGRSSRARHPERGWPLGEQSPAPDLGDDDRDHDVQHHRREQRVPRHRDRRQAEEQCHDRGEREHHDGVVQRHLGQGEEGWPSVSRLQTNTIAVQGAAASRIRPAT